MVPVKFNKMKFLNVLFTIRWNFIIALMDQNFSNIKFYVKFYIKISKYLISVVARSLYLEITLRI